MIIIDKPYVSELVLETIRKNKFPVLHNSAAENLLKEDETELIGNRDAVQRFRDGKMKKIYTISENSIEWIVRNLGFSEVPDMINIFKNKVRFRNLTKHIYPDLFYKEVGAGNLREINFNNLPKPVILKPSVGFFSIGVKKIHTKEEWENTIGTILHEMVAISGVYPEEVLATKNFIIEECIPGEEYAIDAYFNNHGEPVILGILKHIFSSGRDVGDRVYLTSKNIILENLVRFGDFLKKIRGITDLKNFPLHAEVKLSDNGDVVPIEINPMRFGAWCTTADSTCIFYNLNPYECFFSGLKPDWDDVLKEKDGKMLGMIVLDNTTGLKGKDINSFDHSKLLSRFRKPLEFRKIDHKKHNVFGFIFIETNNSNYNEIDWILNSDLREFIK